MNRTGGRGGGGWGRGQRGRGRGRPHHRSYRIVRPREVEEESSEPQEKPPPHLKGREIGMWYAKRQGVKSKHLEIENAPELELDSDLSKRLTSLISEFDESFSKMEANSSCSFSILLDQLNNPKPKVEGIVPLQLQRDTIRDNVLLEGLQQLDNQNSKMMSFRQSLPSFKCKDKILQTIAENQVVVISGETGCGKTTQIGQYLLDDMISQGNGSLCNILCTQPRRISAVSVAERVAEERCERIGSKSVGYVIRLESRRPKASQGTITFCTTGVVFQYLKDDQYLTKYSHILVDEVHERDTMSDILITVLKDMLPLRPDLKVILMSATINAEHFSNYFGVCPMLNIPGMTFPVAEYYLEDIIENLHFQFENEEVSGRGNSRFGYNAGWSDREYEIYLQDYVRRCLRDRTKISVSTINQIMKPQSEKFESLMVLCGVLVEKITKLDLNNGAILVFVTGWDEISKLNNYLNNCGRFPSTDFLVIPLHSLMPTVNQRQIFDRPPIGIRKIIIATNIAETSITIDDVVHVIDFGKIKITSFDLDKNVESLDSEWVSRANAKQRKGRAGRIQEGYCYHLITRARESRLEDFLKPEVLRRRLEEVILQLKLLKLGDIRTLFKRLLDPPTQRAIDLSFDRLRLLNALDGDEEKLTPLGYHLSSLPMHPQMGKMILMGAVFSVVDPIFSVAASLSFKDPFYIPLGKENIVDQIRKTFADSTKSDHWAIVKAIEGYEMALSNRDERNYCYKNFISISTCKMLLDFKKQFSEQLYDMKFLSSKNCKDPSANINSSNIALVKAIIVGGLYPNVAKIKTRRPGRAGPPFPTLKTPEDGNVYLHKKSVNAEEIDYEFPFLAYHMKQKMKKITIFDSTMVSPYPIIFFGGKMTHRISKVGQTITPLVEIDNNFRFKMSKEDFNIIEALRLCLDKVLGQKIGNPSPTDWSPTSLEGQLIICTCDLITSQYHDSMKSVFYDSQDSEAD